MWQWPREPTGHSSGAGRTSCGMLRLGSSRIPARGGPTTVTRARWSACGTYTTRQRSAQGPVRLRYVRAICHGDGGTARWQIRQKTDQGSRALLRSYCTIWGPPTAILGRPCVLWEIIALCACRYAVCGLVQHAAGMGSVAKSVDVIIIPHSQQLSRPSGGTFPRAPACPGRALQFQTGIVGLLPGSAEPVGRTWLLRLSTAC